MPNIDHETVDGFGDEWTRFDQTALSDDERATAFEQYFAVFPWSEVADSAIGFDAGCGSGRWAALVAPRVGRLHAVDASAAALNVAKRNLAGASNVETHCASIDDLPFPDSSMDFGYSLGVLHHVPDTRAAIASCARKLKAGAPLLLYLYYAFDNRPRWFRAAWQVSDLGRRVISRMPYGLRFATSQVLAASVYWPLARTARALERLGVPVENIPLSIYRDRSFYGMRTDALDRFGTRLEQRFTRDQVASMMQDAGLERITFSEGAPYWCAVGYRA
ncbi:MAG: class I SAM-dependent methyltransferase [Labilithrix sp.]|nr:class I SAM-dependent methyltransferase [Labilithrix sp.]